MRRWGVVVLIGAVVAGYYGLGSVATGLGGVAGALFGVFVAAFLVVLTCEAIAGKRGHV